MFRKLVHRIRAHDGQALVLFGAGVMAFVGLTAMSIDVGRYVWARTQMQAAVDAAVLAGAQSMPNGQAEAAMYAEMYWDANSGFIQSQGENVSFVVSYPSGNRAIKMKGDADIPTWFAKIFGIDSWHVSAEGTAASQVLDIAVVLDISGSMCFTSYPQTESTTNIFVMSPGRASPSGGDFPRLASAINATTTSITLTDASIFKSTSSSTNRTNFGSSWDSSSRYYERDPDGGGSARSGMIRIDNELMRITSISGDTLTVQRARTNNYAGTSTVATSHAADAEVWALRSADGSQGYCQNASYNNPTTSTNGPHQPFDSAIDNAKYFVSLFNQSYDKIGLAEYSSDGSIVQGLSNNWGTLNSSLDSILVPNGGTNIAHGLARGRAILDGAGKRPNAVRVLVLLTDGVPTNRCTNGYESPSCTQATGSTPTSCGTTTQPMSDAYSQATVAGNADIIVYTIGLGDGVVDCVLEEIAERGGGEYFKAPTTAQLDDAFQAIAAKTHIALTE
ncbi:MAG: VWA domain-containing protein [Dehalococcoidia bacterium]|nr:VWA domain-containing protein [Dehalococcoidia bacterium]